MTISQTKPSLDLNRIVSTVKSCLPEGRERYGLHEPSFSGAEWDYVKDCLDTAWVSTAGAYVGKFESKLSEVTDIPYAAAVVNGTAALHLSLQMLGIEAGDEVLIPDLTFVATANAVAYCAATPHFVDSSPATLGIDPEKLEKELRKIVTLKQGEPHNQKTNRRIRALVVMHTFGHPVDLDPILEICNSFHLPLIEDAAEALGSFYKNKHVGRWGQISILSFNGNKIVTTGGGGAILTHDKKFAEQAKHLSTTAKTPHPWKIEHNQVGYNYRMPNLNAALGLAQLEKLPQMLQAKRRLADSYGRALTGIPGVSFFTEPENSKSNYWLNTILLAPECRSKREELIGLFNENAVQARPAWELMHRLPMYAACPRMNVETAEDLESRIINLPSSAFLK